MKIAGMILIVLGILLAGREWEIQKTVCIYELEAFYRMIRCLEQEVVCRQAIFPFALESAGDYAGGRSAKFARSLAVLLRETRECLLPLWEQKTGEVFGDIGLTGEELAVMKRSGAAFSLPRKEMIGPQTGLDQECLLEFLRRRREQLAKDRRLFRSLSVAAGLSAVVLLL